MSAAVLQASISWHTLFCWQGHTVYLYAWWWRNGRRKFVLYVCLICVNTVFLFCFWFWPSNIQTVGYVDYDLLVVIGGCVCMHMHHAWLECMGLILVPYSVWKCLEGLRSQDKNILHISFICSNSLAKQSARKEDFKLKFKFQNKPFSTGERFSMSFAYCAKWSIMGSGANLPFLLTT